MLVLPWYVNLVELALYIVLESLLVGLSILVAVVSVAVHHVEGDIVSGEEAVAFMYLTVHPLRHSCVEVVLREPLVLVNPIVDTRRTLIVDASLVAHDACLHVLKVVLFCLLVCGVVSFQLEFLGLQPVTRVILIRYG